jgi:hypothetical protein
MRHTGRVQHEVVRPALLVGRPPDHQRLGLSAVEAETAQKGIGLLGARATATGEDGAGDGRDHQVELHRVRLASTGPPGDRIE